MVPRRQPERGSGVRADHGLQLLIEVMKGVGYKVQVVVLECEWEKAQRRNLARGPHSISANYTDEFNVRWLLEAAREIGESGVESVG